MDGDSRQSRRAVGRQRGLSSQEPHTVPRNLSRKPRASTAVATRTGNRPEPERSAIMVPRAIPCEVTMSQLIRSVCTKIRVDRCRNGHGIVQGTGVAASFLPAEVEIRTAYIAQKGGGECRAAWRPSSR